MVVSPRLSLFPLLIVAGLITMVGVAIFSGSIGTILRAEDPNIAVSATTPIPAGIPSGRMLKQYPCPRCGVGIEWGTRFCPQCGWWHPRLVTEALLYNAATTPPITPAGGFAPPGTEVNALPREQAAFRTAMAAPAAALPTPREQNAAGKEFIEGHWLGLEVIPITPELAKEYQVPKGEDGVLVDEITLEAAESGILAGDMVQAVEGSPTPDLKAFFVATQRVQDEGRARVTVSRRGNKMTWVMEARNTKTLGFAQMEAAQPITPGAISPHRSRNRACTDCHVIMAVGGQLPTDAGDILPDPPPIPPNTKAPHRFRGQCNSCHAIR